MNLHTPNHGNIAYPERFSDSFVRRWPPVTGLEYNDRSPEIRRMNSNLRASANPGGASIGAPHPVYADGAAAAVRSGSFVHLVRGYDREDRDSFTKEAALFAVITAVGFVLPMAYLFYILSQ